MQQIIYFFRKFKYFLFFLLLELIALFLIINNHAFHKSKFINSTRSISGFFYENSSNITDYLNLKQVNNDLAEENARLKNELEKISELLDSTKVYLSVDSTDYKQKFSYILAKIIKNEYHKTYNYLLLNKGENDSIKKEMGVANDKGIIGIIDATSNRYSRVRSILNKNTRINARLKKNYYFGTLIWDGDNYRKVKLVDIPRQADVNLGDTIITGGKSTIFPEGILVGTVTKINLETTSTNNLEIALFNDMANLKNVYIIRSFDKLEVEKLENFKNE